MAYRYLGNKTKIAGWIADTIGECVGSDAVVADLMCGTASVSRALADRRFSVIAADQMRFAVLHAKARLLFDAEHNFGAVGHTYSSAITWLNAMPGECGLFFREYGSGGAPRSGREPRKYFTPENAARIDAMRRQIRLWRADGLESDACDLLLHDLVLAANSVANIAGTYGYFRSSWSRESRKPLVLLPSVMQPPGQHLVLQGPIDSVAPTLVADATYIDPPYTKRQYAGNYHIPETIAMEDEPEPVGDGGLRDWSSQSSDFCYRRRAGSAVDRAMEAISSQYVVWSYNGDGQVPETEMRRRLTRHGRVEIRTRDLARYRSNDRGEGGTVTEYLYIVKR